MKKSLLVLAITLLFLGMGKFYAIDLGQYDTLFSKELEGNVLEVNEQDDGYMLLLDAKSLVKIPAGFLAWMQRALSPYIAERDLVGFNP